MHHRLIVVITIISLPSSIVCFFCTYFDSLSRPQIPLATKSHDIELDAIKSESSIVLFSRWKNPPYIAVLTEPDACTSNVRVEETIHAIEQATADGGVNLVVLRVADDSEGKCALHKWKLLQSLAQLKSRRTFHLVVNDDVDIVLKAMAQNISVDGVHVKERNVHLIPSIRSQLEHAVITSEKDIIIGTSCHSIESATTSYLLSPRGPDYLFVGTCYLTQSHPEKKTFDQLEGPVLPGKVKQKLYHIHNNTNHDRIPPVIFAIGGIDEENCQEPVLRYGADGVAVIRTVMQASDSREIVRRMRRSMSNNKEPSQIDEFLTYINASTDKWSVLEPSTNFKGSNMPLTDTELPLLHGLLFVNKPSGYSTLPTKQKLFPCLSDIVNEWLSTNPKGQQRLKLALEYEDRWWDIMLQTMSSKQQRVLKRWKKDENVKLSTFVPRPVHRLDVDTSGIVCIALTPYALRAANIMFATKSQQVINGDTFELVHKSYVALVNGKLDRGEGTIMHSIGKVWIDDHAAGIPACDISNDGSYAFVRPGDSYKLSFAPGSLREAVTSYRTLTLTSEKEDALDVSRVELTAHTGRSHQLRLHMASMGHPIVGDRMHGYTSHLAETARIGEDRLHLHAARLSINAWGLTADGKYEVCRVVVDSDPPF